MCIGTLVDLLLNRGNVNGYVELPGLGTHIKGNTLGEYLHLDSGQMREMS